MFTFSTLHLYLHFYSHYLHFNSSICLHFHFSYTSIYTFILIVYTSTLYLHFHSSICSRLFSICLHFYSSIYLHCYYFNTTFFYFHDTTLFFYLYRNSLFFSTFFLTDDFIHNIFNTLLPSHYLSLTVSGRRKLLIILCFLSIKNSLPSLSHTTFKYNGNRTGKN